MAKQEVNPFRYGQTYQLNHSFTREGHRYTQGMVVGVVHVHPDNGVALTVIAAEPLLPIFHLPVTEAMSFFEAAKPAGSKEMRRKEIVDALTLYLRDNPVSGRRYRHPKISESQLGKYIITLEGEMSPGCWHAPEDRFEDDELWTHLLTTLGETHGCRLGMPSYYYHH
jgi:hypothetical protein